MNSRNKFIHPNSVKQQKTDKLDPFSNYIKFPTGKVSEHEKTYSYKNKAQEDNSSTDESCCLHENKILHKKIQFNLNENRKNSLIGQQHLNLKSQQNNPQVKGILKANNINFRNNLHGLLSREDTSSTDSKENVDPFIFKKRRLSEIKSKLINLNRVKETKLNTDPFSNYIRNNFSLPPSSIPKPTQIQNLDNVKQSSLSVVNDVKSKLNMNTNRKLVSDSKTDPFSNYVAIPALIREIANDVCKKEASNVVNYNVASTPQNKVIRGTLTCKIFLRNHKKSSVSNEPKAKTPHIPNKSNVSETLLSKNSYISKSCFQINHDTTIMNEVQNHGQNISNNSSSNNKNNNNNNNNNNSNNNYNRHSILDSNLNDSMKKINQERSTTPQHRYKLTDVKKEIIYSKCNPVSKPKIELESFKSKNYSSNPRYSFPVAKNIIRNNTDSSNDTSYSDRSTRSFIPLPSEPKNGKLKRAVGKVLTYNTLIRDIEKSGKPIENRLESNIKQKDENVNDLMGEVMQKMSDYFSNEFDKLAKFNQLIYMKHIENKKRLRSEILSNLSKMTKIQQEILLKHCKELYNSQHESSKNSFLFDNDCKSHNRIEKILETYDSQTNLKLAKKKNNFVENDSNTNPKNSVPKLPIPYSNARPSSNANKSMPSQCFKQNLNSTNIDDDFKKYIDHIRATFNTELGNLTSKLSLEKNRRISNSHHHIFQNEHSDAKTIHPIYENNNNNNLNNCKETPNNCETTSLNKQKPTSKLSEIKSKFFSANIRSESKLDPFTNKINIKNDSDSLTYHVVNNINNKNNIGGVNNKQGYEQIHEQKTPIVTKSSDEKNSLKIDIVNSSPNNFDRKKTMIPIKTIINNTNENFNNQKSNDQITLKRQGAFLRKISPYIVKSNLELNANTKNKYVKDYSAERNKLSEIEKKFLNLKNSFESVAENGNRVYI